MLQPYLEIVFIQLNLADNCGLQLCVLVPFHWIRAAASQVKGESNISLNKVVCCAGHKYDNLSSLCAP